MSKCGTEELKAEGREVMKELGWLIRVGLLLHDARSDGDETALEIARRWTLDGDNRAMYWKEMARADRSIVFGKESQAATSTTSKL